MTDHWKVEQGDCRDIMRTLPDNSVDAIVSDPPYGLSFMGKEWDHGVPGVEFWTEALRVAKPGAHLVAFGGTRTYHRLAVAIEDAGWEVRDCLSWLYGQGFPKSHNLDGEHTGWGTALKPAWEPIILARKPLTGTVAANVTQYGTGAINVDGCRIGTGDDRTSGGASGSAASSVLEDGFHQRRQERPTGGRWPANVCLDDDAAALLDAQSGERKAGVAVRSRSGGNTFGGLNPKPPMDNIGYGDSGGASRFFYTAKVSRREREAGLDGMPERISAKSNGAQAAEDRGEMYDPDTIGLNRASRTTNHHPTVKPIALMRWLCRLVTPSGGLILDPFNGSGSTGCAAVLEGFRYLGCELEAEYVEIARRRIAYWEGQRAEPDLFG